MAIFFLYFFLLIAHQFTLEADEELTIPQLVDIALKNNPKTQTAWWNASRAASALGVEASSYYPCVDLTVGLGHGRDYKFPNGDETTYTSLDGGLLLSYLLCDFGERNAACSAAKAALFAANWQSEWDIQEVMYKVVAHGFEYLFAQEVHEAMEQSLEEAKITLAAASDLQRVGLKSLTDVYAILATITGMEMDIALQKAEIEIAFGRLLVTLGLPVDTKLTLAPVVEPVEKEIDGLDSLVSLAKEKRSDLMASWGNVEKLRFEQERVRRSYGPKLRLGADAGYEKYIREKSNGFNYNVALRLDVPLFKGFESIHRNRMAYADVEVAYAEAQQLDLEIALEVLKSSSYFDASRSILKLAKDNLSNSFKAFSGSLDKYRAGTMTIFDLNDAQNQLADARVRYAQAKKEWFLNLSQLAYATGTIVKYTKEDLCTLP